MRQRHFI
ncbi:hypothetical protein EC100833_5049, partial [Escherichia coli 10.0833]